MEGRNRSRGALAIETSPDDLDRNSAFMRDVQGALSRMDAGTFGLCADCEEPINPKRLAAIPWASSCIACQESADREQKTAWSEIDALLSMAA